ncbi:MAG TPA: SPASM domain-containing protein, partial [Chitinophagaceae bacterium]|nr:SPASM domain-containing protein [Chitinophagaceae bacterium]
YHVSFTTNGYLINQEFVDYFKNKQISCSLQITLDGYREKHDLVRFVSAKKGSYTEIINNIRLLVSNGFVVRLRINYTDKNIEDTYRIAEEFADIDPALRNSCLMFDYHRVWQDSKVDDLNIVVDDNIEKLRDNGYNVMHKSPNNVRDSCYADKRNSAVINYNGDIFKCTARDFTTVQRAGFVDDDGNLIWENDYLNKRMAVKFNNKPCLSCRIMPLCNGGCSQHALDHLGNGDYCVFFGDEGEKDKVVKSKVEEILHAIPA